MIRLGGCLPLVTASPQSIAQCMQLIVCCVQDQLLIQHSPNALWSSFYSTLFFRFSLYTIWPLPDTYPSSVTTLLASWPLPDPKMSCTSYHVLYPFFRTSLLASWPLPHPITFCASYHILYPVYQDHFATASPQNVHFISHTLLCFLDQFDCQLATASRQNFVHFISHTLRCFQDQFACWLSTASPQHIVHFVSCTVPLYQDQFVGQFATA